jgi:hypothetical protein
MQTAMARTSGFEYFGRNALPIIAYSHLKPPFIPVEFHPDKTRLGVSECVSQCFVDDSIYFVPDNRLQCPRDSILPNMKRCGSPRCQIIA